MERLLGSKSIYDPIVAKAIRKHFASYNVVVVDLDGVIAGGDDRILNSAGINALKSLRKAGYALVLWTEGSNERNEVINFLAMNEIFHIFELIIYKENYIVSDSLDIKHCIKRKCFDNVVNSTSWLTEQERKKIIKEVCYTIETKETTQEKYWLWTADKIEYFSYKTPQLFFENSIIIEDRLMDWTKILPDFDINEKNFSKGRCQIIPVTDCILGKKFLGRDIFKEDHVDIIKKCFPLKKAYREFRNIIDEIYEKAAKTGLVRLVKEGGAVETIFMGQYCLYQEENNIKGFFKEHPELENKHFSIPVNDIISIEEGA